MNPAPEEWPEQQRAETITKPVVQARQGWEIHLNESRGSSHRISKDR